jgi:RNA polymerase sigma-70 factor, ECF subfamily
MQVTDDLEDVELVKRVQLGGADSRAALSALLSRHYGWISRLAFVEIGEMESALDCTQQIMLEISTSLAGFSGRSKFSTWSFVIARRIARRFRRRRAFESFLFRPDKSTETPSSTAAADSMLIGKESLSSLAVAMRKLSSMQRLALTLFYLEELTVEEGAERLGCSISTFKVHLHRGREKMRTLLMAEG